MGDNVEFSIAFATTAEKIGALKERIAKLVDSHHIHPFLLLTRVSNLGLLVFFSHSGV